MHKTSPSIPKGEPLLSTLLLWGSFILIIVAVMAVDLGLVNRNSHAVTTKEAAMWTGVWVALALLFDLGIYFLLGHTAALQFITGYVIEYSLSVDNIFVFIVLFSYFKVDPRYRHRVLVWES